jgi:hypothetical protein
MHDAYPSVLQMNDHSNLLLSKLMDSSSWDLCGSLLCERKKVYERMCNDRSEKQTVFENVNSDQNPYSLRIEMNNVNFRMVNKMIDLCLEEMNIPGSHATVPFNAVRYVYL